MLIGDGCRNIDASSLLDKSDPGGPEEAGYLPEEGTKV